MEAALPGAISTVSSLGIRRSGDTGRLRSRPRVDWANPRRGTSPRAASDLDSRLRSCAARRSGGRRSVRGRLLL